MLCHALDAVGLEGYRVGLGDAALYPALLSGLGVDEEHRERLLQELATKDFVGLEREVRELDLAAGDAELLVRVPQLRGGPDVLEAPPGPGGRRAAPACATSSTCSRTPVAERVIFDLGLARGLGYYTGAVFDVYDPALGEPLGGGGRYDDLLGRFGRALPAVGFALGVDRLHAALAGERAVNRFGLTFAVPRGALLDETLDALERLGVDAAEVRTNDRKLLFGDVGIVTMRPSDVPTYVEAGAADLGIMGKDVLMEQPSARSSSCSTSATAAARWCSPPSPASPTPPPRRCGAWASCAWRRSTRAWRRATSRTPAARPRSSRSRARSSWRR